MKKLVPVLTVSLILLLAFSSLTMAGHKIMLGYDMEGKYEIRDDWWDGDDDNIERYDTESGLTIGYECTYKVRIIEYGFGFETQLKRGLSDYDDTEFKFSPLYGTIYVNFPHEEAPAAFFVARLGYNMHAGNRSYKDINSIKTELGNGVYSAVGFGFNFDRSMGALLYSLNSGSRSSNTGDYDRDVAYSKFSIVYGFKF